MAAWHSDKIAATSITQLLHSFDGLWRYTSKQTELVMEGMTPIQCNYFIQWRQTHCELS